MNPPQEDDMEPVTITRDLALALSSAVGKQVARLRAEQHDEEASVLAYLLADLDAAAA